MCNCILLTLTYKNSTLFSIYMIDIGYLDTGLLFFRDRWFTAGQRHFEQLKQAASLTCDYNNTVENNATLLQRFNNYNVLNNSFINSPLKEVNMYESSGNLFFRALYNPVSTPPSHHYQDSSVVVINRNIHSKYIKVMSQLLPSFNAGFGDKELFWVSATRLVLYTCCVYIGVCVYMCVNMFAYSCMYVCMCVCIHWHSNDYFSYFYYYYYYYYYYYCSASVPYAFSPYLASGLSNENIGTCILHYDPLDNEHSTNSTTILYNSTATYTSKSYISDIPLYVNAEVQIEQVDYVGHRYYPEISSKTIVSYNMTLRPVRGLNLSVLHTQGHRKAPSIVQDMYLRAQWCQLNMMRHQNYTALNPIFKRLIVAKYGLPPYTYIPIRSDYIREVSNMIKMYILDPHIDTQEKSHKGVCDQVGCPVSWPLVRTSDNTIYYKARKVYITFIEVYS